MCKYCEDNRDIFYYKHSEYTHKKSDFCPKCGTPLGEVKPLTKEQLEAKQGKPVYVVSLTGGYGEWAKFMNCFDGFSYILSGAWKAYGGMDEYGVEWVAYETEPAEKTWIDINWENQHD